MITLKHTYVITQTHIDDKHVPSRRRRILAFQLQEVGDVGVFVDDHARRLRVPGEAERVELVPERLPCRAALDQDVLDAVPLDDERPPRGVPPDHGGDGCRRAFGPSSPGEAVEKK